MIPFFLEQLANINVARATIAGDSNCPVEDALEIKNNSLRLGSQVIIDFDALNLKVDPSVLVISPSNDDSSSTQYYDVKLSLTGRQQQQQQATDGNLSAWTADNPRNVSSLACRACKKELVRGLGNSKDLPSEHWYELVECWICHETKPEEHRARMQPILARENTLLVGASYALVHADNAVRENIQVDTDIAATIKVCFLFFILFSHGSPRRPSMR